MQKTKGFFINVIFFVQALLIFLLIVEDHVQIPVWLQVAGRLHPVLLHLPIGLLVLFMIFLLLQSEFKKKAFHKIGSIILFLTSLTASFTALFGFLLSRQGDYGTEALSQHKISGTILSLLCFGLLLAFNYLKKIRMPFYGFGLLSVGFLLFTGHTGGILTHGENYVFSPLSSATDELAFNQDGTVFQMAVYPVLKKKCTSCHNEAKAKGKFVMTSIPEFKKGGKHGKEWEEGNPGKSRLIQNIHLPLEDDDHMPPDGKAQLTKQEIDLLEHWIKSGADFDKKLSDLKDDDTLKVIALAQVSTISLPSKEKQYEFAAASDDLIKKLTTPFRAIFPLYQNSAALQADFFIKESFQATALEELKEIQEQLVVLNLSKMPVTDNDLSIIGNFKNLEKLNLNYSKVKGPGLSSFQSLNNLTSLSMVGTEINLQSLKPVLELPALTELFIWNTRITEDERSALVAQYPRISIVTSQFKDDRILRLGKPVLENEGVVKKGELVTLKHSMPGVIIRYSLDGTNPDTLTSMAYDAPLKLAGTSKIKAVACKQGWYCSDVFEMTCFLEGQMPVHTELLSATDSYYPGEGAKILTDGWKGFIEVLVTPAWLGYKDRPFIAGFDFKSDTKINSIVISYAKNLSGKFFPPMEVEVWGGKNLKSVKLIKAQKIELPIASQPQQIEALTIPVTANYSFYKLVAKPVEKLPKWHGSKGKKGWLLIDEVIFN